MTWPFVEMFNLRMDIDDAVTIYIFQNSSTPLFSNQEALKMLNIDNLRILPYPEPENLEAPLPVDDMP
jgi:hypothetical protein